MRRKVLLINPLELYFGNGHLTVHIHKPALLALFSYLKHCGFEVDILDLEIELGRPQNAAERASFHARSLALLKQRDFDLAAVSCYGSGLYLGALEVGRMCREVRPEALRVVGGYHATGLPSDFTGPDSPFDFVVSGEGEYVLAEIATGLHARGEGTRVLKGRPLDMNEKVPLMLDTYRYARQYRIQAGDIGLSRGCPFQCVYCVEPASEMFPKWRAHPEERSLEMVDQVIREWNPLSLYILDPIFGFRKTWRRRFLRELIARNYSQVFGLEIRVDVLEPEDLELFAQLPVIITLGIESTSPEMLLRMGKSLRPQRYIERVRDVLMYKASRPLMFSLNFLFNHPGDTPPFLRQTMDYFWNIVGKSPNDLHLHTAGYKYYPGTPISDKIPEMAQRYGTEIFHPDWWRLRTDEQYKLSEKIIASREMKEKFGLDFQYWQREASELGDALQAHWSPQNRLVASVMAVSIEQNYAQWQKKTRRNATLAAACP